MPTSLEEQLNTSFLWLERLKPESQAIIKDELDKAQKRIIALSSSNKSPAVIKKEINQILNDAFAIFPEPIFGDQEKATELAYNATQNIMTAWTTIEAQKFNDASKATKARLLNTRQLIQGHTLNDHLRHLNRTTTRKIQGVIANGFEQGQGIQQINQELRNTFGNLQRNQMSTLVRTFMLESIRGSQEATFDYFKDEIEFYVYSSTLDSRTSLYCWNWSNYKSRDKQKVIEKLSSHYNCRSIMIVETSLSKQFDDEQKLVQWNSKTVSHRDQTKSTKFTVDSVKKIPSETKGQKGFDFLDDKFKREYLGPTRYKLYKDGKATLKQMTNLAKNDFITLDQLEKKLNL